MMRKISKTNREHPLAVLRAIESPALLMQADPRLVVQANKKASVLFDKSISQIEGLRGGQVFDCLHAFTEAGCGKDINCENCKIKNAVLDTFATGRSNNAIRTSLDIKKNNLIHRYDLQVSTRKIEEFVLMTIDTYMQIA